MDAGVGVCRYRYRRQITGRPVRSSGPAPCGADTIFPDTAADISLHFFAKNAPASSLVATADVARRSLVLRLQRILRERNRERDRVKGRNGENERERKKKRKRREKERMLAKALDVSRGILCYLRRAPYLTSLERSKTRRRGYALSAHTSTYARLLLPPM